MSADSTHPLYDAYADKWVKLSDCYAGEDRIKERGTKYLPPTAGMEIDGIGAGQDGRTAYDAYVKRAVFHDFIRQAVEAMVGVMHREPARIEVPKEMEPLIKNATADGESLQMVLRKINEWQLLYGRAGMLAEAPNGLADALPHIALYAAPRIINWDDGIRAQGKQRLEFVVFDESNFERQSDFQWEYRNRYRVIAMSDVAASFQQHDQSDPTAAATYQVAVLGPDERDIHGANWVSPMYRGQALDEIPFVFVNTKDMVSSPDDPPLDGLANLALAIYRGEADYRQSLHMQGQETFVIIGAEMDQPGNEETRLGNGARLVLPKDGDAKFVGVSAAGLMEQKDAISNDKMQAGEMTSRLFDSTGTSYQSGDALRIRVSAKTATLRSIAGTGAEALAEMLRMIARWIGADESKVLVEPNNDFADTTAAGRTLLELVQAKQLGAPLSLESIHRYTVQQGLTVLTYDQEKALLDKEEPVDPLAGIGGAAGGVLGASTGGDPVSRGADDDGDDDE